MAAGTASWSRKSTPSIRSEVGGWASRRTMTAVHDVVIVGGGGAGLRAAIAVAELDPRLSVAVVSKVYPMRSHTVSAEGGAAGAVAADDSPHEHAYHTGSRRGWPRRHDPG